MKIIKEGITPRQLLFSVIAFIQSSSMITSYFTSVLKQNSWAGVLVAYLAGHIVLWVYLYLLKQHPGKSIVEINDALFGRIVGKVVSSLFIFYFFSLIVLNTYDVHSFIIGTMMPDTPSPVLALIFIAVPVLLVRKGMDSIARTAAIFCFIVAVSFLIFSFLELEDMHPEYILPILHMPVENFIQGTHTILVLPFCELIVFAMIIPSVDDQKKVPKCFLLGYSFGALSLLFFVLIEIFVLGHAIEYFSLPGFEVVRLINLADVISRMETLYALVLYILRFFKVSVLIYACSLAFAQTTGMTEYRPFASVIAVLAALISLFVMESAAVNAEWGTETAAIYSTFFNIVVPFLALAVYLIRNTAKNKRAHKSTANTAIQ